VAKQRGAIRDRASLNETARQVYEDGLSSLAIIDIVENANSPAVVNGINQIGVSSTLSLLASAAISWLLMVQVRAYSEVTREDDRNLHAAILYLKSPNAIESYPLSEQRLRLSKAVQLFDAALGDNRLKRLKRMRDKHIAHMAAYDFVGGPTYNELYEFTKLTSSICEHLAYGTGTMAVAMEQQMLAHRRSAQLFWSKFITPTEA